MRVRRFLKGVSVLLVLGLAPEALGQALGTVVNTVPTSARRRMEIVPLELPMMTWRPSGVRVSACCMPEVGGATGTSLNRTGTAPVLTVASSHGAVFTKGGAASFTITVTNAAQAGATLGITGRRGQGTVVTVRVPLAARAKRRNNRRPVARGAK